MLYIILFIVVCIFIYSIFSKSSTSSYYNSQKPQSTYNNYSGYNSNLTRNKTISENISTKNIEVKGTEFFDRSNYIKELNVGDKLLLTKDYSTNHDKYLINVYDSKINKLGYIPENNYVYLNSIMNGRNSIKGYVSSISKDSNSNYQLFIQTNPLPTKKENQNTINNNSNTNNIITTKIAGVTFDNRQIYVKNLKVYEKVKLIREPDNKYDKNAVAIYNLNNNQLGYIPKDLSKKITDIINSGKTPNARVRYTSGGNELNYGATIEITFVNQNTHIDKETFDSKSTIELSGDLVWEGVQEKRKGNFQLAKKLYLKAIDLDPTNIEAYLALGKVNYLLYDFNSALNAYSCVAHLNIHRVNLYSKLKDDPNRSYKLKKLDIDEVIFCGTTRPFYEKTENIYNSLSYDDKKIFPCKSSIVLLVFNDLLRHTGHCFVDKKDITSLDDPLKTIIELQKIIYRAHISGGYKYMDIIKEFGLKEDDYWFVENSHYADCGLGFLLKNLKWDKINYDNVLDLYLK